MSFISTSIDVSFIHHLPICLSIMCPSIHLSICPFVRLLDWRERKQDGPSRTKYEKIIIFKHLFDPKEFEVN